MVKKRGRRRMVIHNDAGGVDNATIMVVDSGHEDAMPQARVSPQVGVARAEAEEVPRLSAADPKDAMGSTISEEARQAGRDDMSLRINGLSVEPAVTVMDRAHATGKHEGLIFAAERLLAAMARYRDRDGPYVALRLAQDEIMAEIDRMRAAGEIP